MKKETKKAPTIRFRGFTDNWEQRKVGDLTVELSEYLPLSSGYPLLTSSRNGLIYQNEYRDTKSTNNESTLFSLVPVGSCTYRHMSDDDVFHLNINNLESGLVSREYPVFLASDNNDLNFLVQNINFNPNFRSFCSAQKKGGTRTRLYYKNLCKFRLMIPSASEQKRVSEFLATIDSLVALHQRKLDQLKTLKKYFLQNMFPAKGEKVPRIRFKGFTGDWEQRKLSNCVGFRRGSFPQPYGNKEWYNGEGAMPFVQVADVTDDMKLVDDTKQKISKVAQPMSVFADKGSVLVTLQGSIGRVAIMQYGAFVDRTVLIFNKYNQDIDKIFWAYIIKEKFINEARKAPGGTIKTITKKALSNFDLVLPSYEEQRKLGAFLVSIDSLITLHQRKLDQLQTMKKFMLQNMFI